MEPRLWNILVHVHADKKATVRVHVDARLLLPICESQTVEQALQYVEAVLVDCQPHDRLALRAQGADVGESLRTLDVSRARAWLSERATELLQRFGAKPTVCSDEGARSGTRPILKPHAEGEAAALFKKSSS